MQRPPLVLVAVTLLAVATACGTVDEPAAQGADSVPATANDDEVTSTTPAPRQPTGGVVLAGDSIAGEVAHGLEAALAGQPTSFTYVGQPSLAGDAALQAEWTTRLAELDPAVVVVMVGTWERLAVDAAQPGWQESYVTTVLGPWIDQLTANGTDVVFAAYPPLEDDADALGSGGLNDVWASLPERFADVSFVDAGGVVRDADGDYIRTIPIPGVGDVLVRQSDGRHLCPDGVMFVADRIAVHLQERFGITVTEGWQRGEWRNDPENFEHPELCGGQL